MSRIGKQIVKLNTATVELKDQEIIVKGPKGELKVPFDNSFELKIEDKEVTVVPKRNSSEGAKWGLYRSLLQNAVIGVEDGFERRMEMIGVGYRAQKSGKGLTIHAGYSHPIEFEAPEGVALEVEDNTKIVIAGIDKQLVGHVASQIRKIRKPEPYKGKGIKYAEEVVRRKPGKAGKAGGD